MTTNFEYILQDLFIPEEVKEIIEPFCGKGDLLSFIDKSFIDKSFIDKSFIDIILVK